MRRAACLVLLLLGTAGAATAVPAGDGFSPNVTNPWFPLRPGVTLVYRGVKDGKPARDVVTVTGRTRVVGGVRCRVVEDRLYLGGRLAERTTDWYAQHRDGSVWYFGEETAELGPNGKVLSTEGTWQAGIDGARAGIYMPAHPRPGQTGRQEYYRAHAEDHFRVLGLGVSVRVPGVASRGSLLVKEWTPLEPGVIDHKYYVRGIGTVKEQTVKGGDELLELVAVQR
jgi:hypothetical protein